VHREGQRRDGPHPIDDAAPAEELVQSLTRLYCYLYRELETALRPAPSTTRRAHEAAVAAVTRRTHFRLLPAEYPRSRLRLR